MAHRPKPPSNVAPARMALQQPPQTPRDEKRPIPIFIWWSVIKFLLCDSSTNFCLYSTQTKMYCLWTALTYLTPKSVLELYPHVNTYLYEFPVTHSTISTFSDATRIALWLFGIKKIQVMLICVEVITRLCCFVRLFEKGSWKNNKRKLTTR